MDNLNSLKHSTDGTIEKEQSSWDELTKKFWIPSELERGPELGQLSFIDALLDIHKQVE